MTAVQDAPADRQSTRQGRDPYPRATHVLTVNSDHLVVIVAGRLCRGSRYVPSRIDVTDATPLHVLGPVEAGNPYAYRQAQLMAEWAGWHLCGEWTTVGRYPAAPVRPANHTSRRIRRRAVPER